MNMSGYQNFIEDSSIFMNKQEFRDQSHLSPINYSKSSNKKRSQQTYYSSSNRTNGNPQITNLSFTPFLIEPQQKQISNQKNQQQISHFQGLQGQQILDQKNEQKQKAIQQNINRQIHIKKGAQFRNITLDKIQANLSHPNPQMEMLKVTQKKINNQFFNLENTDLTQQSQNVSPNSHTFFNRKRTYSIQVQNNKFMNASFQKSQEQPINSNNNEEDINNIITEISSKTSRQKTKKNFRIQPTCNIGFLNSLYEKRFLPSSHEMSQSKNNENEQDDMNKSLVFQKYSEQKNPNIFRSPLSCINPNKLIIHEQGLLNHQSGTPSPLQIQSQKHENQSVNNNNISPLNSSQQRKRELIHLVQNQPQNNSNTTNQKNLKYIELDYLFYDSQQKNNAEDNNNNNIYTKTNQFFSSQNSPTSFNNTQAGGFQTLKQRAVSPKDTLLRIKNINNQNVVQNMCLSFKKEDTPISSYDQSNSLKTEIMRKIRKDSFQQYKNNNNNSRGFPYQIQFENKVQQQNKPHQALHEHERLESWNADYRQDTTFGFESYPTQENYK